MIDLPMNFKSIFIVRNDKLFQFIISTYYAAALPDDGVGVAWNVCGHFMLLSFLHFGTRREEEYCNIVVVKRRWTTLVPEWGTIRSILYKWFHSISNSSSICRNLSSFVSQQFAR